MPVALEASAGVQLMTEDVKLANCVPDPEVEEKATRNLKFKTYFEKYYSINFAFVELPVISQENKMSDNSVAIITISPMTIGIWIFFYLI